MGLSIAALQAKRLGIERIIAIVRDPHYISLLEDSGVVCIGAPYATAAMVENYLDRPGVAELFTELFAGDHVVLVGPREEVKAAQDSFTGKPAGAPSRRPENPLPAGGHTP